MAFVGRNRQIHCENLKRTVDCPRLKVLRGPLHSGSKGRRAWMHTCDHVIVKPSKCFTSRVFVCVCVCMLKRVHKCCLCAKLSALTPERGWCYLAIWRDNSSGRTRRIFPYAPLSFIPTPPPSPFPSKFGFFTTHCQRSDPG